MTTADEVLRVARCLRRSSIGFWLDRGWGVDALLGEETRPHDDLDLVVREADVLRLRDVLEGEWWGGVRSGLVITHHGPGLDSALTVRCHTAACPRSGGRCFRRSPPP